MLAATQMKFRVRDATATLAGQVDLQIVVELAVWGVVAAWLLRHLAVRSASRLHARRPWTLGFRMLVGVGTLIAVSSLYATTMLAVVRAVQYLVLIGWALLCCQQVKGSSERLVECWVWIRRLLWVTAILATIATAVLGWGPTVNYYGIARYRWLAMHPIATASMLSLAVITLAGSYLAVPDGRLSGRNRTIVKVALLVLFTGLLVATRSRGAIAGTVAALVLLTMATPSKRKRASAVLLGLVGCTGLLAGVGSRFLEELVFRGQTTETLQNLNGRLDIFAYAWELLGERPILGYGYLAGHELFLDAFYWSPGESHNVFIEIAVSMGVVGLAAFALLLGRIGYQLVGAIRNADFVHGMLAREAAAVGVYLLINGLLTESFVVPSGEAAMLVWAVIVAELWQAKVGPAARKGAGVPTPAQAGGQPLIRSLPRDTARRARSPV